MVARFVRDEEVVGSNPATPDLSRETSELVRSSEARKGGVGAHSADYPDCESDTPPTSRSGRGCSAQGYQNNSARCRAKLPTSIGPRSGPPHPPRAPPGAVRFHHSRAHHAGGPSLDPPIARDPQQSGCQISSVSQHPGGSNGRGGLCAGSSLPEREAGDGTASLPVLPLPGPTHSTEPVTARIAALMVIRSGGCHGLHLFSVAMAMSYLVGLTSSSAYMPVQ